MIVDVLIHKSKLASVKQLRSIGEDLNMSVAYAALAADGCGRMELSALLPSISNAA